MKVALQGGFSALLSGFYFAHLELFSILGTNLPSVFFWYSLVVGPVLKIKTGFRGFETEQSPGFRKCAEIW